MNDQYFISDTERIFKELVRKPEVVYCEIGKDFYRFTDPASGKSFVASVKEVKKRERKVKKISNNVI